MDILFLDANVLFSAAYDSKSRLRALWDLQNAELVSADYAVGEASRNLPEGTQARALDELMRSVRVVEATLGHPLPPGIKLPEKDHPILNAAIKAGASHLLTGDERHFRAYFGRTVGGVVILRPAEYLRSSGR